MNSIMHPKPYKTHDGKDYCGHLHLGGDGERCELDAWAEFTYSGWRIYWTGEGIPQTRREYAVGRWETFQLARAAWERASRAVSDSEKLRVEQGAS